MGVRGGKSSRGSLSTPPSPSCNNHINRNYDSSSSSVINENFNPLSDPSHHHHHHHYHLVLLLFLPCLPQHRPASASGLSSRAGVALRLVVLTFLWARQVTPLHSDPGSYFDLSGKTTRGTMGRRFCLFHFLPTLKIHRPSYSER